MGRTAADYIGLCKNVFGIKNKAGNINEILVFPDKESIGIETAEENDYATEKTLDKTDRKSVYGTDERGFPSGGIKTAQYYQAVPG